MFKPQVADEAGLGMTVDQDVWTGNHCNWNYLPEKGAYLKALIGCKYF